ATAKSTSPSLHRRSCFFPALVAADFPEPWSHALAIHDRILPATHIAHVAAQVLVVIVENVLRPIVSRRLTSAPVRSMQRRNGFVPASPARVHLLPTAGRRGRLAALAVVDAV